MSNEQVASEIFLYSIDNKNINLSINGIKMPHAYSHGVGGNEKHSYNWQTRVNNR